MKTYKIKPELFKEIANNINIDDLWQDIIKNELQIGGGQYLPRLAGGLSHFVCTSTEIEIHDRGMTYGSNVQDNSFRIIPEVSYEQNTSKKTIKEKIEIENNNIIGYLSSNYGRCLKVAHVEKLCGVPKNTIQNIANGHRKISVNNVRNIVYTLKIFGYKTIFDWDNILHNKL